MPTISKKYRVILSVLMITTTAGGFASLFLPYLVKLNVRSGDLSLPVLYEGSHYGLAKLIPFIMVLSIFSVALIQKQFITIMLSGIVLILTYLVRHSIHFQGFIDHDYDTKTGTGFLLLFIAVIAHFIISLCALILQMRNRKTRATIEK